MSKNALDEIRQDLSDMVEISGRSATSIAESVGLTRSGVLRFLKGYPGSLGEAGISKMFLALHVEGGRLSRNVVHYFSVKNPDPLLRILKKENKILSMVYISPSSTDIKDFMTLGIVNPLFVFSPSLRIVVRQPSALSIPVREPLLSSGLAEWLPAPPDPDFQHPNLRVSREIYDKIQAMNLSLDEYDRIVSIGKEEVGWEEVFRQIKESGLSPRQALFLLKKGKK